MHRLRGVERDRYTLTSHFAIFRMCPDVLSGILRRNGSFLLAAKILVISRLLYKKLADQLTALTDIDRIRARLGRLRLRLLQRIDRRLNVLHEKADELLGAMCAYSLVTSSSAMDVFRHFHRIRLEAISLQDPDNETESIEILEALRRWVQTIRDSHRIFPRQLAVNLERLKSMPLLSDQELRSVPEFDYDVHEPWIGEDIKNFKPYVRYDDLSAEESAEQVSSWASDALKGLNRRLQVLLSNMLDAAAVAKLRTDFIGLWFSGQSQISGIGGPSAIVSFRDSFNDRLNILVRYTAGSLKAVMSGIADAVRRMGPKEDTMVHSLWDYSQRSSSQLRGTAAFARGLRAEFRGESEEKLAIIQTYQDWFAKVEDLETVIDEMKHVEWNVDVDDNIDFDYLEDDTVKLLTDADPVSLQTTMLKAIRDAFDALQDSLNILTDEFDRNSDFKPEIVFVLRVLRDIRQRLPKALEVGDVLVSSISNLYKILCRLIVDDLMIKHGVSIQSSISNATVRGRSLWDGDPELPVLPSPWAFKLLKDFQLLLADVGHDIWNSRAVETVKESLCQRLADHLSALELADQSPNNHSADDNRNGILDGGSVSRSLHELNHAHETNIIEETVKNLPIDSRDWKLQHLFDLTYLDAVMHIDLKLNARSPRGHLLHSHQVVEEPSVTAGDINAKVERNASDYWSRTSLLFGLLAA